MLIDEELTLKKLETFLAFMRSGNLGRAAAELSTSAVSVHRAIHSLESALRCPLFKHEGRQLIPLESAYVLEKKARQLIQDASRWCARPAKPPVSMPSASASARCIR